MEIIWTPNGKEMIFCVVQPQDKLLGKHYI